MYPCYRAHRGTTILALLAVSICGACAAETTGGSEEASTGGESRSSADASPSTAEPPPRATGVRTRALILTDADEQASEVTDHELFRLRVRDDRGRVVAAGDTMRSGDQFYVEILPLERVYVFMMYRGPDGGRLPLYPRAGQPPVELFPGSWTRVPGEQFIELDDQVGEEQLYVFVSKTRFSDLPADDDTAQTVDAIREGRTPPPVPPEETDVVLYTQEALAADLPTEPDAEPVVAVLDEASQQQTSENPTAGAERHVGRQARTERPRRRRPAGRRRTQRRPRPNIRTRGLTLAEPNDELRVAPDDEGVSVVVFPITHVAR